MLKHKSLRTRRFIARYVTYIEVFGYLFVVVLAAGIFAAIFYRVDDAVKQKDNPEIRPRETIVKNGQDAFITRLFVTEKWQPVRKGDPIAEIIEDPAWVERYQVVSHLQVALRDWKALEEKLAKEAEEKQSKEAADGSKGASQEPAAREKTAAKTPAPPAPDPSSKSGHQTTGAPLVPEPPPSPLALEDTQLRASVEQALTAWDAAAGQHAPRKILRAKDDGVVVFDDKIAGQVVEKNKEIATIADFSQLEIKLNLLGENQPDVRVNQIAKIAVRPEQVPFRALRGDREGFLWRAERVQFNDLIDDPIKDWLRDELKKQPVTRDDGKELALEVTDIQELKVDAKLKTTPVGQSVPPGEPGDLLKPDHLHDLELRGHVSEVKHTASFFLNELPPKVEQDLADKLLAKVRGKVVPDDQPFRIEGFRSLASTIKVKSETSDTVTSKATRLPKTEEERERQIRHARQGVRSDRAVEATIVLDDPPAMLIEAVQALYQKDKPSGPRVDVDVVTERRRFAMLLFRQ